SHLRVWPVDALQLAAKLFAREVFAGNVASRFQCHGLYAGGNVGGLVFWRDLGGRSVPLDEGIAVMVDGGEPGVLCSVPVLDRLQRNLGGDALQFGCFWAV